MFSPNTKTMKPTDFSKYISDFISAHLLNERGASANTITAYRDAFVLLLNFIQQVKRIRPEKLTLDKIKKETIIEFLNWLQRERKCSNTTRNARLAAMHSFYRYLQHQDLSNFHEVQKILSIRFKKTRVFSGLHGSCSSLDVADTGSPENTLDQVQENESIF